MSVFLAAALAAAIQPTCSWDRPGQNPYTGSPAAAIDRYTDIPAAVRSTLKRRIEERQADDSVTITRDAIAGKSDYDPAIHDMHFGAASVCASVTRSKWAASRAEPAAVYCVGEHCILVPRICGNVSRISKLAPKSPAVAAASAADEQAPVPQFADISLIDPDLPDKEMTGPLDNFDPADNAGNRRQLASSGASEGGVEEFVLSDELDLDSLADQYARRMAFGIGINGGGDGIIHTAVPEADTWAMLLGGLGLMGWAARRRAKAAAGAAR
ncbi:PEP-CTERM sorting domain-containing protein [Pseudoduganella sp. FT25W]|uniref:PEP-CTERM sorting domain-containing protein n=1 Tax=Duganella alba TaxID=2666081 RepID=A0A6L5QIP3_9BURK|nr:MHFG family PEP-CTERM protein [Duganella alba]MRX09567.1 PEP-CTERM sorting domain-containing protein [Duganella alba]MRX18340.1 PEP-CTERM sorting domain-containing protein [Duganella alba]